MSQPTARVPCTTCGYTSDPGSLFCALCGSALRPTAPGPRTAYAWPVLSVVMESAPPEGAPESPALHRAEETAAGSEPAEPEPPAWLWAGVGAAALALFLGLLVLALNPALLPPHSW